MTAHANVEFEKHGANLYVLWNLDTFKSLKIKDNKVFGTLTAGGATGFKVQYEYSRLELFVKDSDHGNLKNLTVEEYNDKIEKIISYLKNEYGVTITVDHMRLKQMEINCTFLLEQEFYKYHRALQLLMYNLPARLKNLAHYSKVNAEEYRLESGSFYRGNASMLVKIYDKKEHLQHAIGITIPENIMRIEIVLRTPQKIKQTFGSNYWKDMSNHKINEYFMNQFEKLFEESYVNWHLKDIKYLSRLILDKKKESPKHWKSNLLQECRNKELADHVPVLLDMEDLLAALKAADKHGHYAKEKRGILRLCREDDVFLQKDTQKVQEIVNRVHEAYDIQSKFDTEWSELDEIG